MAFWLDYSQIMRGLASRFLLIRCSGSQRIVLRTVVGCTRDSIIAALPFAASAALFLSIGRLNRFSRSNPARAEVGYVD